MPNYFAIGFVSILACVGVGMEYHRQSVQAGVPITQFGPSQFVAGVKNSVSTAVSERKEQAKEVRRASLWQGEMRQHLPEAPTGWKRRGFDEGDNTAVVPAGAKAPTYGKDHPLHLFVYETWANTKNMKHVRAAELRGKKGEDLMVEQLSAGAYVYSKGEETVLIELRLKEEQETETIGGNSMANAMAFALSLDKHTAEPEPFAVIAGIPFFEAFDREGLMLAHYRVLYAKVGLHEEVRLIVHANASSGSTRALLREVDFEGLNDLLRIPMTHVSNDLVLPDAKTEEKYAGISDYVRLVAQLNLKTHTLQQSSSRRTRRKPEDLVAKYGDATPLRDMYVMQYRDAMQSLVEIDDLANQLVNMNELIAEAAPIEEDVAQKAVQEGEAGIANAEEAAETPSAAKATMSAPLKRELDREGRSAKAVKKQVKNVQVPKPKKASVPAKAAKPQAKAEKKIKVNRLGGGNTQRRLAKKAGCGGGSFCKVSN